MIQKHQTTHMHGMRCFAAVEAALEYHRTCKKYLETSVM
jgi:hypothetical protein